MVSSLTWIRATFAVLSASVMLSASAAPSTNAARQVTTRHGTLASPSSGVVVAVGSSFPFTYQDSNWCEDGYTQISVWLTDYAPTTANLNSTGQFPEGEYSYNFGSFLIPNFGLPVLSGSTPPPSTLVLPAVDGINSGDEVYLSVVETGLNCPPGLNVPPQYGLTDSPITVE